MRYSTSPTSIPSALERLSFSRGKADVAEPGLRCQPANVKIDARNYDEMRAWFARILLETIPAGSVKNDIGPVERLDQIAGRWPGKARSGLAMAISDTIEATEGWPRDRIAAIDSQLLAEGLPSLTAMRLRFSKDVNRVVRRGRIKSEVEYYMIRNAAELTDGGQEPLLKLLRDYETQQGA